MSLREYRTKRNFSKTREPRGKAAKTKGHLFVVQKHDASHLHYDFRLELNGVLKSWAVPKGPPQKDKEKRLAVEVEDHPVSYADFEGEIPDGEYGAGHVEVWDQGTWTTEGSANRQLQKGHLEFELKGNKLHGKWLLVRTKMKAKKANWLLIKRSSTEPSIEAIAKPLRPKTTPLPAFIEPALCTLVNEAPPSGDWLHEVKYDGYRTLCRVQRGKTQLLTRSGLDWTEKYPLIAQECKKLKVQSAYLDGEVCWVDDKGLTDFSGLQKALKENSGHDLVYFAFDLLYLNGKDLREVPLIERKKLLQVLIEKSKTQNIVYSDHHASEGALFSSSACSSGFEGIISKRANGTYQSGRTPDWLKSKCKNFQEFVIGGYTFQKDSSSLLGALLVGTYNDHGELIYHGRVGTGFDRGNSKMLLQKLKKLPRAENPFHSKPPGKAIWVKPHLVAQVEFGAWTEKKILRHAAFKGLREDKKAKTVRDEKMKSLKQVQKAAEKPSLSHPEKVLFPKRKITKKDLYDYYQSIQKKILPHVLDRPLSLLRCPEGVAGTCFFQKHLDGEHPFIKIQSPEDLQKLIQVNTLELHCWNCHDPEKPDLLVFDIDPSPGVSWQKVKQAALDVRALLLKLNLKSFVKVSGSKGLHVHVPIRPTYGWDEVKNFARSVCKLLVADKPEIYTVQLLKKNRTKKIFLDYLRNGSGATAVAPYSVRAKEAAAVALPISWKELTRLKGADIFSMSQAIQRVQKRSDPWKDYFKLKQKIHVLEVRRSFLRNGAQKR